MKGNKALKKVKMVQIQENLSEKEYDPQQSDSLWLVDNKNKCI